MSFIQLAVDPQTESTQQIMLGMAMILRHQGDAGFRVTDDGVFFGTVDRNKLVISDFHRMRAWRWMWIDGQGWTHPAWKVAAALPA